MVRRNQNVRAGGRRSFRGRRFSGRRRRGNAFNGRSPIAPTHPKPNTLVPWNTCIVQRTVAVKDSTAFTITAGYVYDTLIAQLQLAPAQAVSIRVMMMTLYDMAGRPISCNARDYHQSVDGGVVATGLDYPGRNGWARVRIVWPKSISAMPLNVKTGSTILIADGSVGTPHGIVNTTSTDLLLKIHVLWRVSGPVTPKEVASTLIIGETTNNPFESSDSQLNIGEVIDSYDRMEIRHTGPGSVAGAHFRR